MPAIGYAFPTQGDATGQPGLKNPVARCCHARGEYAGDDNTQRTKTTTTEKRKAKANMKVNELTVETKQDQSAVNQGAAESTLGTAKGGLIMVTPPINEEYWLFRVRVSAKQSVVAFPKFFTIGIGFQIEEQDWNTNLPYTTAAEEIERHIRANAVVEGDDARPSPATIIAAIKLLQAECAKVDKTQG